MSVLALAEEGEAVAGAGVVDGDAGRRARRVELVGDERRDRRHGGRAGDGDVALGRAGLAAAAASSPSSSVVGAGVVVVVAAGGEQRGRRPGPRRPT